MLLEHLLTRSMNDDPPKISLILLFYFSLRDSIIFNENLISSLKSIRDNI
jgi:hypothetical protein